jgi:hTAFII28-like protein conserved region
MMAQLLATFSPQELRRFQSFQRVSFSSSVIEPFVAACIQHRTGGGGTGPRRWSLDDCVAPGHAAEIGLLVAVAAKIYAQRLVAAAVRIQNQETTTSASRRVLRATSVYRAVQERRGNPAGLFIPSIAEEVPCRPCVTFAAAPSRRDAALAAQEAYDAAQGVGEIKTSPAEAGDDDAMNIEEPAPLPPPVEE